VREAHDVTDRPVLKFSRDWSKLNERMFTTIRKAHPPYDAPEMTIFQVETPTRKFLACLTFNTETSVNDLSTDLLTYDTDTDTREHALAVLNGFYHYLPTRVQLMLLIKIGDLVP
jgi:hypothetical protein